MRRLLEKGLSSKKFRTGWLGVAMGGKKLNKICHSTKEKKHEGFRMTNVILIKAMQQNPSFSLSQKFYNLCSVSISFELKIQNTLFLFLFEGGNAISNFIMFYYHLE
jgi:hypothetical protein